MLRLKERGHSELFVTGSLRQLLPDDHVLVRVDGVLDLSWLRGRRSIKARMNPGSSRAAAGAGAGRAAEARQGGGC